MTRTQNRRGFDFLIELLRNIESSLGILRSKSLGILSWYYGYQVHIDCSQSHKVGSQHIFCNLPRDFGFCYKIQISLLRIRERYVYVIKLCF